MPALVFFFNKMKILLFLLCLVAIYGQVCVPESDDCATCREYPSLCTGCKSGVTNKYLHDGECVKDCPDWTDLTKRECIDTKADCPTGYVINDDKKTCESFGGYLFSGIAIVLALLTLI